MQFQKKSKEFEEDNVTMFSEDLNYDILTEGVEASLDLEQDYLQKLKIQRQRIQELTRLYANNQEKLIKEIQINNTLRIENQKYTGITDSYGKLQDLRDNYERITQQKMMKQSQIENLKQELAQVVQDKNQNINKLKGEINALRNKKHLEYQAMENKFNLRQEELDNRQNNLKDQEKTIHEQIHTYRENIHKLKKDNQDIEEIREKLNGSFKKDLAQRDRTIFEMQRALEEAASENAQLRGQIYQVNSEYQNKIKEIDGYRDRIRSHTHTTKRQAKDKDNIIHQLKTTIKKNQTQYHSNNNQINDLKLQNKNIKEMYENVLKQISTFNSSKYNMQCIINQHKITIEELMKIKNQLMNKNKQLMQLLRRKEAIEKQRRMLMKNQFKEIDKLEKAIDRIE